MRVRRVRLLLSAAGAALFLLAAPRAAAETLTLTYVGDSGAPPITFSKGNASNVEASSSVPGPHYWQSSPPPNGGSNPLATFCIELTEVTISGSLYAVTALADSPTINGDAKATAVTALYGNRAGYSDGAFQLALWELVYDGVQDLADPTAPNFLETLDLRAPYYKTVTQEAQALLNATLTDVAGGIAQFNSTHAGYSLVALVSAGSQDQLWLKFGAPPPRVPVGHAPAPPGVVLGGIAVLAFGLRSRWLRRPAAPA